MKSSLRKLRGIAGHHRVDSKEKKAGGQTWLQLDELARASQVKKKKSLEISLPPSVFPGGSLIVAPRAQR